MSKHTPGPWYSLKDTLHEGQYFVRVQTYGYAPLATVRGDKRSTLKQSEANARLISAAPDLLEALKSLLWYVDQLEMVVYSADDNGTHEEVAKAKAAMAKATGEKE